MALIRRREKNFFTKLTISTTSFTSAGQLASWNFNSVGLALLVESNETTDIIEYSFNSTDVHGDLSPTLPSEGIIFDNRIESKIWFRRAVAGSPVTVRIEAWRHDA